MRAISLDAPRQFRVVDIPEPAAPANGEALVRVHRIGICGTDYGGYLGKMPYFSYPRIPGHELGVEVLSLPQDVTHLSVSDRCSVEPYINCQHCYACRRGFTNCCESHKTLGVMCDGGMTERMLVPARKLHRSSTLTFDQLALVETLAIGCHAIDRGMPKSDEVVLVIGAGPIGLSAIEFAKISGARTIAMDTNPDRLEFAHQQMKVPDTILLDPTDRAAAISRLSSLTGKQLADVVVDATGSHQSMGDALEFAAIRGRVVYVGITQQNVSFPHAPIMHRRELTLMASRNALSSDFARIIRLIEDGTIDTGPWITHHAQFADMIEVFPEWLDPTQRVIKAIVHVD